MDWHIGSNIMLCTNLPRSCEGTLRTHTQPPTSLKIEVSLIQRPSRYRKSGGRGDPNHTINTWSVSLVPFTFARYVPAPDDSAPDDLPKLITAEPSKYMGVSPVGAGLHAGTKWMARYRENGKQYLIGVFASALEAALARDVITRQKMTATSDGPQKKGAL